MGRAEIKNCRKYTKITDIMQILKQLFLYYDKYFRISLQNRGKSQKDKIICVTFAVYSRVFAHELKFVPKLKLI